VRERERARENKGERKRKKKKEGERGKRRKRERGGTKETAAHLTSVSYVGCFKWCVQLVDDDAGALLCTKFDSHVLRCHLLKL